MPKIDSPIEDAEKVFVVRMPNQRLPNSQLEWEDWQISVSQLETELNQNSSNFKYNFPDKLHSLSASLLASSQFDVNSISPDLAIPNTSIGHDGVVENSQVEIGIGIDSPFEVNIGKSSIMPRSISNVSSSEIGSINPGSTEIGILEIGSSKIGSSKIGTSQSSLKKDAIPQVGISKIGITDRFLGQPNSSQVSPTQVNSIQRTDKFKGSISEGSPTQIDSFQLPSISNHKLGEVSFPSSIAFEQFVESNRDYFHNSTPQIINNLNHTATKIWSNLLQPSTQLDIDLQITDLPTGQLAEATITGFNENGTPNAGTIQIDHDANGVGWFIDTTPWENSEFAVVGDKEDKTDNGETYLLAAAESEANGKYDLLAYTWNFDDDNVVRTNCRSPQPVNHGHSAIASSHIAPVINNIQLPETIIEGTEITIEADVTDPGNDQLTYTWNFDDDNVLRTNCRSPQPINHGHLAIASSHIAPVINNIQLPETIIEGTEITIEADVTDPGNDQLTYTWNFGDDSVRANGGSPQPVNHTYLDNGTYNAILTVTEPYGGTDSQTFDITVDNAAPVVEAGADITIDQGETATLSGTYTDLGINDTHTIQ